MRQRWKLILGSLFLLGVLAATVGVLFGWEPSKLIAWGRDRGAGPIRLGLLHSKSGSLAISEQSVLDAEIMAIDEINEAGGIGNRKIVWSAPDCQSDPVVFASQARDLIDKEQVAALFGAWSSECRKAVVPVVEEKSSLLFFPGNFEGIEKSPRVIYAGGAANQSVLPAVRWAYDSMKARRFFVVGLEEVWSRCSSEIGKDGVKAAGGEVVGESYLSPLSSDVDGMVESIRQANPDVVLNFLIGDPNIAFYSAFHRAGFTPDRLPIVAFGFSEDETRRFNPADVTGHYAAWNYFQTLNRPENREFVRRFRAKYGESRMVGDSMVAAYNSVRFWAQAAREVGTTDIAALSSSLDRQSMDAPDGIVTIDPMSRVVWRPFHVGRMRADGQLEIIWSIERPIRPVLFVGTRTAEQWRSFLENLHHGWGDRWSAGAVTSPVRTSSTR